MGIQLDDDDSQIFTNEKCLDFTMSRWWFQRWFIFTFIGGRISNLTNAHIFQMGQWLFLVPLKGGR